MDMLMTTVTFVLLTALAVLLHLRARGASGPVAAEVRPCPRCDTPVATGSTFCRGCGVPQQVFELVGAGVADAGAGTAAPAGPVHAIVRADVCVGCGTCVDACPEPGALRLIHKLAVVDLEKCTGHGNCAAACPVGGIALTSGAAVQRVETPELDANFQSNVAGLYIVGELGGRGLIKNAINEGKVAVEAIGRELRLVPRADAGEPDMFDLAIVGSGPAGLSAGLEALRSGLSYVILEQGTLSDTIRRYPRHKLLLAEPVRVPLYGDLWVADASKEQLLEVWEQVIAGTGLDVRTGHRVEEIATDGDRFRLVAAGHAFHARRVVLAMGRRGTPRRLGVAGEELPKVFYDIVEMEAFAGSRMLVVGGGDSAVESALGLANQRGCEVTFSYRGEKLSRVKPRNQEKFDQALARGRLSAFFQSHVREIRQDRVMLDVEGQLRIVPNDFVVVRIGGDPPYQFLERIGVRIVQKELALPEAQAASAG